MIVVLIFQLIIQIGVCIRTLKKRCYSLYFSFFYLTDTDVRRQLTIDEDDLLQYAIEQSLVENTEKETDKVDIWEALRGQSGSSTSSLMQDEEAHLQRYFKWFSFSKVIAILVKFQMISFTLL